MATKPTEPVVPDPVTDDNFDADSGPVFQGNPGNETKDKPDFSRPNVVRHLYTGEPVEVPEGFTVTTADGYYSVVNDETGEHFRVEDPDDITQVLRDLDYDV